jgi:hypothetical protein
MSLNPRNAGEVKPDTTRFCGGSLPRKRVSPLWLKPMRLQSNNNLPNYIGTEWSSKYAGETNPLHSLSFKIIHLN